MNEFDAAHAFRDLAAAFCRGRLGLGDGVSDDDALAAGTAAGLRLHRFKRNAELPRVRHVLGTLRGLGPEELLDVGSGRGTFLWPMLDALPRVPVQAIDRDAGRAADLDAVHRGGVARLSAACMDATAMTFADGAFDVATALEVLEHMERPDAAARELVRVARRAVVVTVPSREDDNPEHIQLFDAGRLRGLFVSAGARNVNVEFVPGHIVAVVSLGGRS